VAEETSHCSPPKTPTTAAEREPEESGCAGRIEEIEPDAMIEKRSRRCQRQTAHVGQIKRANQLGSFESAQPFP
jgi:hypothetical protein